MNGLEFKKIRKQLNLTQEDLGKELGLARKTISGYENSEEIPTPIANLMREMSNKVTRNEINEPSSNYQTKVEKDKLQAEIEKLKEILIGKTDLIDALKKNLESKDLVIKSLNTQLETLQKHISEAS